MKFASRLTKTLYFTTVAVSALTGTVGVAAQSCSVINQGASEVQDAAGSTVKLPAPQVRNCADLRVIRGSVVACTVTARSHSTCRSYTAGQTLAQLDPQHARNSGGPWYTLSEILRGSPGRVAAVSRGRNRDASSLPTGGVVLLVPQGIAPDFDGDATLRGIDDIEIHIGSLDGPLLATLSANGSRTLMTSELQPGQRYAWRINPEQGNLPVTGEFRLLSDSDRRHAKAEFERIRTVAAHDAAAEAVMWAGWLASHGCEHEAAQVLLKAGFDVD